MTSMNVSITPELMKLVQAKVKSGLYNNASEVVREALRQFDTNAELLYQLKLDRLKQALAEGIRQAEAGDTEEFDVKDIIAELDAEKTWRAN